MTISRARVKEPLSDLEQLMLNWLGKVILDTVYLGCKKKYR